MEYINIMQPLILVFVSFCAGAFFGSLWMFYIMYKEEKALEKELDSKNKLLETYMNVYEDDDYEAY